MRICHLYDEHYQVGIGQGSVSSIVFYLARATAAKGHDVTVFERRWGGLPSRETCEGVTFRRFDLPIGSDQQGVEIPYQEIQHPTGLLGLLADRTHLGVKLARHLRRTDFDVLHVHLPFTANVLMHVLPSVRSKTVYTAHVGEEKKRFNLGEDEEKPLPLRYFSPDIHLMKRVAKAVVLNDRLQSRLEQQKDLDVTVIPNGIDLDEFPVSSNETARVKEKYEFDTPSVMFTGTITPQKGVEVLVKAAKIVEENTDREVTFLLVGNDELDEEYANRVKEYVRTNGLEDTVRLTGYVPYEDLKALYTACDIFVLPSYEEGMPMVLLEALASGKPLVGSDIGGIAMQVEDSSNGYLVTPGDEKMIAEHIRLLVEDEQRRQEMGEMSRQLAEDRFKWSNIVDQYLSVYHELV